MACLGAQSLMDDKPHGLHLADKEDVITRLLKLQLRSPLHEWETYLEEFGLKYERSASFIPAHCDLSTKRRLSSMIYLFLADQRQSTPTSQQRVKGLALRALRTLMRERAGVELVLREEALKLFLSLLLLGDPADMSHEMMCSEAVRCLNNYLFDRPTAHADFLSNGGLLILYELLSKPASAEIMLNVSLCLVNLLHDSNQMCVAFDKLNPLRLIVPTMCWLYRADRGVHMIHSEVHLQILNQLLKILFILEAKLSPEDIQKKDHDLMTQLGVALTELLFLPLVSATALEVKTNVVNLLIYSPGAMTHFLSANNATSALLQLLECQLDSSVLENVMPLGASLMPVLGLLLKIAETSSSGCHEIKRHVFPEQRDIDLQVRREEEEKQFQVILAQTAPEKREEVKNEHKKIVQDKGLHPEDAPKGSLRAKLMKLMTCLDSNVKRFATELIFELCNKDPTEFTRRTGVGNAIALLKMKNFAP